MKPHCAFSRRGVWDAFTSPRFLSLLLLTLPMVVQGQLTFWHEPFWCTTRSGRIIITGYAGTHSTITIPSIINGLPVGTIGDGVFAGSTNLTSIILPDSLTTISGHAFARCTSLATITIPNSVTTVWSAAFEGCASLTTVTIGSGLSYLGYSVFAGCTSLEAITVDPLNAIYSSLDGVLLNKSQTVLIQYPMANDRRAYTLPHGVTAIADSAFSGATHLTGVTMPDALASIGAYAFAGCSNLLSVAIPAKVTTLGTRAFASCTTLTSVTMPEGIVSIPDGVFSSCTSLTNARLSSRTISVGSCAFQGCPSLPGIVIPENVSHIGAGAFSGCTSLTSIAIPEQVAFIAEATFKSCASLRNILLPWSIGWIEGQAFSLCPSLTNVSLPSQVTSIADYAFNGCTGLRNITFGHSLTGIGAYAFAGCTNLTTVTIPGKVVSFGAGAFSSCTNLAALYFYGNAPAVGTEVFGNANHATLFYLPGTTGWGTTLGGRPTALWWLVNPVILDRSVGVKSNGFGFTLSGPINASVQIEACTNLGSPAWSTVSIATLADGSAFFTDPLWTNYAVRFYRSTSPAQSPIVGHVNITIYPNYNLLANPLSTGVRNGADEIMTPIDGEQILTWNSYGWNYISYDSGFGGWIDGSENPNPTPPSLPPGKGFFLFNPNPTPSIVTFVGEVIPAPCTTNRISLASGYSLLGSPFPADADLIEATPVSLPLIDGMQLLQYSGTQYSFYLYDTGFGGWVNSDFQPAPPPRHKLGQGFFLFAPNSATWSQTQSCP